MTGQTETSALPHTRACPDGNRVAGSWICNDGWISVEPPTNLCLGNLAGTRTHKRGLAPWTRGNEHGICLEGGLES